MIHSQKTYTIEECSTCLQITIITPVFIENFVTVTLVWNHKFHTGQYPTRLIYWLSSDYIEFPVKSISSTLLN